MSKVNWKELIDKLSKDIGDEALKTLKENSDFFADVAKEELILILHYVAMGDEGQLNAEVYASLLRQMSDEDFVSLRSRSAETVSQWSAMDLKKRKICDDLKKKVGKMAADLLIRHLLLGSIL